MGTLMAVVIVFRQEIIKIISALLQLVSLRGQKEKFLQKANSDPELKMAAFIVIGSIPTAVLGLFFASIADRLFSSTLITGLMLIVTGFLLWVTRKAQTHAATADSGQLTKGKALIIGIVQGLAIIPGISRSGSTISTGLLLGVDRETAARYSFLLAIPAIVGAGLLSLKDGLSQMDSIIGMSLLGAVTAALVGYGALKSLLHMVKKGRLYVFAPYCWLVGIVAILFSI